MSKFLSPRLLGPLVLGLLVVGCGKSSIKVEPVRGKVTVDGQPVTSGQVSLLPTTQDKDTGNLSAGTIDTSGEYKIFTAGKEGAPAGKYKVTVTPSMVPMTGATTAPTTPFNAKYRDAKTTPLEINVVANPAAGAYDLKLTK